MKTRFIYSATAVAAAVVMLACSTGTDSGKPVPGSGDTTVTEAAKQPAKTYHQPKPEDFKLKVAIKSQKCFGRAGCNLSFEVQIEAYTGGELDPGKTYDLTYEVKGLESAHINTSEITGTQYRTREETGSTESENFKLSAAVTSVSES